MLLLPINANEFERELGGALVWSAGWQLETNAERPKHRTKAKLFHGPGNFAAIAAARFRQYPGTAEPKGDEVLLAQFAVAGATINALSDRWISLCGRF
jgi:hypothetical protein